MLRPDAAEMKRRRLKRDKEMGLIRQEEITIPEKIPIEPNFRRNFISSGLQLTTQNWHIPGQNAASQSINTNTKSPRFRSNERSDTTVKLPPIQKGANTSSDAPSGTASAFQGLSQYLESKTENESGRQRTTFSPRAAVLASKPCSSSDENKREKGTMKNVSLEDSSGLLAVSQLQDKEQIELRHELSLLKHTYQQLVVEADRPLMVPDEALNATAEYAALQAQQAQQHRAAQERKRVRRCMIREEWLSRGVEEYGRLMHFTVRITFRPPSLSPP